MAAVQKQFEAFHQKIRTDYEFDSELRSKRDIVLEKIRTSLRDNENPSFDPLHQGSYKMRTGVQPIDDVEWDIDVGLRFDIDTATCSSTTARKWVFDAVAEHTKDVTSKGPCVRVRYQTGLHIDLVVYGRKYDAGGTEILKLASRDDGWREADPAALLTFFETARSSYSGTEDTATKSDQLRRCVRYLKRWYDEAIPRESDDKPSGLGFTLLLIRHAPKSLDFEGCPKDLTSLLQVARYSEKVYGRIVESKPTPEYEDVFGRLSALAAEELKTRFGELRKALEFADASVDPVAACSRLKEQFGRDFPVPSPEETSKKTAAPAIIKSTTSAT